MPDTSASPPAKTHRAHPAVGVAVAAVATILIALGLDVGFTTHYLLQALGIPDTLAVRGAMVLLGLVVFVVFGVVYPQVVQRDHRQD